MGSECSANNNGNNINMQNQNVFMNNNNFNNNLMMNNNNFNNNNMMINNHDFNNNMMMNNMNNNIINNNNNFGLNNNIQNNQINPNKKFVDFDEIMVVQFISSDQKINKGIKCLPSDTFAKIEEELYKYYPEYRKTNNNFVTNGGTVLKFQTLAENNIKDGQVIELIKIE